MTEKRTNEKGPITQHALFRIGVILISVLVLFAFAKEMAIPASFGEYGRYRGDSIGETAAKAPSFAGSSKDCGECHRDIYSYVSEAEHKGLDCQSCHGPAAKHVQKPSALSPKVIGNEELCAACHRKIAGRVDGLIATVKPMMHSGGVDCVRCHDPHRPWAKLGGKKG